MTKNIIVVDSDNNIISATYPKRAEGLVKKQRAQWIDKHTIRLLRPDEEDNKMADSIYNVIDNQLSKLQEQLRDAPTAEVQIELIHALEKMSADAHKTDIIPFIREQIEILTNTEDPVPDTDSETFAAYLEMREVTKQQILKLLEKLV